MALIFGSTRLVKDKVSCCRRSSAARLDSYKYERLFISVGNKHPATIDKVEFTAVLIWRK